MATLVYNFGADNERRVDVDMGRDSPCPLLGYRGQLFVARSFVLGFIDNVAREGRDNNLYIQTSIWDLDLVQHEHDPGAALLS